jgi:hypothetical protein
LAEADRRVEWERRHVSELGLALLLGAFLAILIIKCALTQLVHADVSRVPA